VGPRRGPARRVDTRARGQRARLTLASWSTPTGQLHRDLRKDAPGSVGHHPRVLPRRREIDRRRGALTELAT
jgi:hypothetical protein